MKKNKKENEKSFEKLLKLANKGKVEAMNDLALRYYYRKRNKKRLRNGI